MKTLLTIALVAALGTGSAFMVGTEHSSNGPTLRTDGAFRDGLYLGRLAAQSGGERHVSVGRWATAQDKGTPSPAASPPRQENKTNRTTALTRSF